MCGIFGIIIRDQTVATVSQLHTATDALMVLSESRGKEAAGIITYSDNEIRVYKEPVGASTFIRSQRYIQLITNLALPSMNTIAIIGQTRLATNGLQTQNRNNQPIVTKNTVGVHNGIIVNDTALWKRIHKKPMLEVDTEVIFETINTLVKEKYTYRSAVQELYARMEGSATIAMLSAKYPNILLTTNTGSLYYAFSRGNVVFASEEYIVRTWLSRHGDVLSTKKIGHVHHLHAGTGISMPITGDQMDMFSLKGKKQKTKNTLKFRARISDYSDTHAMAEEKVLQLYRSTNKLRDLKKHDFDYDAIYALRRCTKCILPETTPFISFDAQGICNYCQEHERITYKGVASLEELVAPYRSMSDTPDCIVAFSGGRDSSYGLHYLKTKLKLNPIAYTYDWGMVKDIARRNEARMVGKLGIEHIIVSADITMKRNYIRKNILAWMKKPDLGMVPLFMVGDKQCEYYADKLARQNNIQLVFFCRGNELEKEEFKTGHCGIKNADPGGVIHNLSLNGKIRLAAYYGNQFMANPSYLNTSMFDTVFGYFSTYVQKHNYVFLWHYIRWDEQEIISTLKNEYNWETSSETIQTWRTDDGTSPFYNYIYYTGQGFTENDSFRSRQIREGTLDRHTAESLVREENKPHYEALQWYFDQLGLDGDEVLKVVDSIPLTRRY